MRVFSGIQPTSQIHIGNYLGAIKQWVDLQSKQDCIFCIVDLHSLTADFEPKTLQTRILDIAIAYIAAGLDPKKAIIFVQSNVKEHSELCWLLSTITPLGELERMTQFKDKSKKNVQNTCPVRNQGFSNGVNAGLLYYPVLMAADILLYQTELVPVGKDQKQHVELAKTIAKKFNNKFGKTFNIPNALIAKKGAKIMSLSEPMKKMSKSDSPQSYISLFDSPKEIEKKIMSSQTDSDREIKYDEKNKPGISNLLNIYSLFNEEPISEIEKRYKDKGYKIFKQDTAKILIEKLEPFRRKKKELGEKTALLKKTLEYGAEKAQKIAEQTMAQVKKNMNLLLIWKKIKQQKN